MMGTRSYMAIALTLALSSTAHGQALTSNTSDTKAAAITALMPLPQNVNYNDGRLSVTGRFRIEWVGHRNPILERAVLRFQNDVARRTGLDFGRTTGASLRINCRNEDKGYLSLDAREG